MMAHYLYLPRLIVVLLILCIAGCGASHSQTDMANSLTPLFLQYKVQGGVAGGTRYLFVITTTETNVATITNATKRETYVVSERTAKEVSAVLQEHDFLSWKSEESSKYADVLKMTLTVTTPSTNKQFVAFDSPDKIGQSQKKLANLVERLQHLAKQQGRLLK